MRLGEEGYSPTLLRLLVTQGARYGFTEARQNLRDLAGVDISAQHVDTLTVRLGRELVAQRDRDASAHQRHEARREYAQRLQVAAVMPDGGRVQTRQEASGPGVHAPQWREPKYAACLTLPLREHPQDPQPEPPAQFLDRQRVPQLVKELQRVQAARAQPSATGSPTPPRRRARRTAPGKPTRKRPRRYLVRTAVATLGNLAAFTSLVAAEVYRRGLDLARLKACVADGQAANWTLYEEILRELGFVAILDFLPLLTYSYAAAQAAGGTDAVRWARYEKWLRWAWQGQGARLWLALQRVSADAGMPPPEAGDADPRKVLRTAAGYVQNNLDKMDYRRYRRLGLPISSAPVESLIKQFNRRVKGSEKFWNPSHAEAVLQLRAAELSEDHRLERFWNTPRPCGRPRNRAVA